MIIDISKYQNVKDWPKLKSQVEGVYIKATEGVGYIDPGFNDNVKGAAASVTPYGFYHFATLNSTNVLADSTAEATSFYNATKLYKPSLPFVLDIEKNELKINPADVLKYIENFFAVLASKGITDVALYSYTPFLDANLPVNHILGRFKLWLAAYVVAPPKLPKGWNAVWLWQYASDGSIEGIIGKVDLNKKI